MVSLHIIFPVYSLFWNVQLNPNLPVGELNGDLGKPKFRSSYACDFLPVNDLAVLPQIPLDVLHKLLLGVKISGEVDIFLQTGETQLSFNYALEGIEKNIFGGSHTEIGKPRVKFGGSQ